MSDTSDRQTTPTYLIGGKTPYGFGGPPPYTRNWVPGLINGEQSLYERQSWDDHQTAEQKTYSNPPFIGLGSSATRVPQWMMGEGIGTPAKRILRGYIRRYAVYPFNNPGLASEQKASSARLFFMYNPSALERSYISFDDWGAVLDRDPLAAQNAGLPSLDRTQLQFELLFDRQEEVSTQKNHPGVLVDLAVFDLLTGGNTTINKPLTDLVDEGLPGSGLLNDIMTGDTGSGGDQRTASDLATATDELSGTGLAINYGLRLVVIFSPTLTFRGRLSGAQVIFEKFSHRMVPTRMRMVLALTIDYIGPEPPIVTTDPIVEAAIANAKNKVPGVGQGTGTTTGTQQGAPSSLNTAPPVVNDWNHQERLAAMEWGRLWVDKVPYTVPGRCGGIGADSRSAPYGNPTGLDCSSLVSRCLGVIGWSKFLGIQPCDTSDNYLTIGAKNNPNNWYVKRISEFNGDWEAFNKTVVAGDLLLRTHYMGGRSPVNKGHVAWIYKDQGGTSSNHSWLILHTGGPSPKPVSMPTYTTGGIMAAGSNGYDFIARPYGKPVLQTATVPS